MTTGVLQSTPNCVGAGQCQDGFVTKINASGASFGYSTFFGTNGSSPSAIDVDASGDVALGGGFIVPAVNPIVTANPINIAVLNPTGSTLLFSSALATTYGIKFDSAGDLYVTGAASTGLMVTSGALQTTYKSQVGTNAFVAKISNSVPTPTLSYSPSSIAFGSQVIGIASSAHDITLTNCGSAALGISSITITGTNAGDYGQTNTCGSSLAAGANCTISVIFTPTTTGTRTASVSISDNVSGSPQTRRPRQAVQPSAILDPAEAPHPANIAQHSR